MYIQDIVYRKSPKGIEAISNRQLGLVPKLRSTLILVDGKRGFAEIARLSASLGDPRQLLEQLFEEGFIEPAPAAGHAPAAEPAAVSAPSALTLAEARRFAVRRLTDVLGPSAEELCLRIESAHTLQDFQSAVHRAENIVRDFRGPGAAAAFAAEIAAHRPG